MPAEYSYAPKTGTELVPYSFHVSTTSEKAYGTYGQNLGISLKRLKMGGYQQVSIVPPIMNTKQALWKIYGAHKIIHLRP